MNNLENITKWIKETIKSSEFLIRNRMKRGDFTRSSAKLTFEKLIVMLMTNSQDSSTKELVEFLRD